MKKYSLPYGKQVQEVMLPEEHVICDMHGNASSVCKDVAAATLEAIRNPIGRKPLREIVKAGESVVIVISDITRLCGTDKFLPVIVKELNDVGVKDEDITLLVATGTHRAHTPEEDIVVVGEELAKRLKIVQHDCRDKNANVFVRTTTTGNQAYINKLIVEADRVILTGAVTLHPFAGYGGGRKAILPGCASYETIMFNHVNALDPEPGKGCNAKADASLIEGNPVALDMKEGCAVVDPDFLVNTVFTPDGEIAEVVAGDWWDAWKKGTEDLIKMAGVEIPELADVVIASSGGFPKDINLYQATKCHMNAAFAVKKDGIMIYVMECPDIKEPPIFSNYMVLDNLEEFEKDLRANFTVPGFVAFKTKNIIKDAKAFMVTKPENFEFVAKTGHTPCASLEEAWALAQEELAKRGKKDYTITIMGHGSATLPLLKK